MKVSVSDKEFQYGFTFPNHDEVDKVVCYVKALLRMNFLNTDVE